MKFEEFKKYKKIAESRDPKLLGSYPEAAKIYQWMEDNERIDEGFWGAIWSWLKRNFSPTAMKLHKLADEYEKELTAEIQAEYGKLKNAKDLNSKFRRSFAGRIADDIEDKMELIASDDDDYRELVRTLVNKKKLKVKKKMLVEFSNKMDPEDVEELENDTDSEIRSADAAYNSAIKKISRDKQEIFREATSKLNSKISSDKSKYGALGFTTTEKVQELIKIIIYYQNALADTGKDDFTIKAMEKTLAAFLKFVTEGSKKLEGPKVSKNEATAAIVKATLSLMKAEKPQPIEKLGAQVYKKAEDSVKGKKSASTEKDDEAEPATVGSVKDEVTTPETTEIITKVEVEKTIRKAEDETEKSEPTTDDVIKEIEDSVKTYFENEKDTFKEELSDKVKAFNKLSDSERMKIAKEYNYFLGSDNKLTLPKDSDMIILFKNLIEVAGMIVPYFNLQKGKRSRAFYLTTSYMFEIYGVRKNIAGEVDPADIAKIVNNIKEKYK